MRACIRFLKVAGTGKNDCKDQNWDYMDSINIYEQVLYIHTSYIINNVVTCS